MPAYDPDLEPILTEIRRTLTALILEIQGS